MLCKGCSSQSLSPWTSSTNILGSSLDAQSLRPQLESFDQMLRGWDSGMCVLIDTLPTDSSIMSGVEVLL